MRSSCPDHIVATSPQCIYIYSYATIAFNRDCALHNQYQTVIVASLFKTTLLANILLSLIATVLNFDSNRFQLLKIDRNQISLID